MAIAIVNESAKNDGLGKSIRVEFSLARQGLLYQSAIVSLASRLKEALFNEEESKNVSI